jgi:hypothetical protein
MARLPRIMRTAGFGLLVVRELEAIVGVAVRPCVSQTMAPSSPAWQFCAGARRSGSSGTTLRPASHLRTPSSSASTAGYATSCSMRRCLSRSRKLTPCWLHGRTITTTFATQRARRSHAERIYRSQCLPTATGRGAALGALRPAPLLLCFTEPTRLKCHRDTTYWRMKVGAQVSPTRL